MYSLGEIRVGQVVVLEGEPFLVTYAQHSKQARGAGVLKTKVKNLLTGSVIPKTFQGNDKLAPADVGYFKAQYLYKDADGYQFLHNETYEQFVIDEELMGDDALFLVEGEDYDIRHFEEKPISVSFPLNMLYEVTETPPGVKGDTAQGGTKPATLSNGITVNVPLFVDIGEMIRIDTRTREYLERVQK
jgi:elongation factor P